MVKLTEQEFKCIASYILRNYGIDLHKKQFLIESKLWIELARYKVDNYTDYWQLLMADRTGQMKQAMIDLLTTNYTYFCREEAHFTYLTEHVIPFFRPDFAGPLQIWCAACATGQECYTLAMYLMDCQRMGKLKVPFQILGTDISSKALDTARKYTYAAPDYARLPDRWQKDYCEPLQSGKFKIRQQIVEHVKFQSHNLLTILPRTDRFQVVFCRNVLIYFNEEGRQQLISNVERSLLPGGYLFIGHTENINGYDGKLQYIKPAVFMKEGVSEWSVQK